MPEQDGAHLLYTARPAVHQISLAKGASTNFDPPSGHDLEIISFYAETVCDATVITRYLALKITDATGGTGNVTNFLFEVSPTASQTKRVTGGHTASGLGGADAYIYPGGWIVKSGGSIATVATNYQAGDTWTIQIIYRDIPVNLIV